MPPSSIGSKMKRADPSSRQAPPQIEMNALPPESGIKGFSIPVAVRSIAPRFQSYRKTITRIAYCSLAK
jgi:hypothetical protein